MRLSFFIQFDSATSELDMRTAASMCEWTPGQTHRHVTLDIKERLLQVFSDDITIASKFRKEYDDYLTSKKQ